MSKIVSNSEIHLDHCLCESRGFKIGKSNHRRCSVKKVFLKILQNWQKRTCVRVRHWFTTYWQFYEIFENTFFTEHFQATASDEVAWWSKILIPSSFLKKIFVEIIGVFNSESCWKKELCNSPCWPLGSRLHVNHSNVLRTVVKSHKGLKGTKVFACGCFGRNLKNFSKFAGKSPCWSPFIVKLRPVIAF